MQIRRFNISDCQPLWQLHFQTIRQYCIKDYSLAQVKAWAPCQYQPNQWQQKLQSLNPFVVTINENIAAYADLQDDGYIDHFYCATEYIGQGVGGHLMRHIIALAQSRKMNRLYSQVSLSAKPFFAHFDFNVVKSQTVNVRGVSLQNFVMERIILPI
ncbi:GNAT family N-acetyltransferase [Thalassotalea aquiviva]|uniref:GNAT family N-acetyltransferase n=1 Tax=Thalassotalea aquiviva TaxID=3242415 RepID=UPI00352B030B